MSEIVERLDPRVKRTRALIEAAFLELIYEKGMESMTVGDITQRAEINRSTFYAHYRDKYELFDIVIRQTYQDAINAHLKPQEGLTRENVQALIRGTCEYFIYLNGECPPYERTFRPVAEHQVQRVLENYLEAWLPNAPMTVHYLSWAIFGTCLSQLGRELTKDIDQVANETYALTRALLFPG